VVSIFDRATLEFASGSLRITKLDLSPTMSEERSAQLRGTLLGSMIVC
jgi:hypothetical protein